MIADYLRGRIPAGAHTGAAGGAACGDLVRVSIALDGAGHVSAGHDAHGCAAARASAAAAAGLVDGLPLLEAARVGVGQIDAELGGLGPGARHGAELAADALHRALGGAARACTPLPAVAGRVLVAMSGGVDSSVAALLSGPEAVGVTLELWADAENDAQGSCCSAVTVRRARALAHDLGLPHLSIDLRAEFRAGVVEPWLSGHAAGLTPNPCVACNGRVRLHGMLELAERLGAEALATGHYARVTAGQRPLLRVAVDEEKDQSYMLAALDPAALCRLRFPLGELEKAQVRERARAAALSVAEAPDSQDLCFLAGTDRRRFLERHGGLARRAGAVVDRRGTVLGQHEGAHLYTVGQRRGLGLGGGEARYVLATDPVAGTVTVGTREELATRAVSLRDVVLHRDGAFVDRVRLRYHSRPVPCRVRAGAGRHARLEVELFDRAEAAAPGQSACLMAGELIVGEGTITARAR